MEGQERKLANDPAGLVEAIRAGDRLAEEWLVRRYQPGVRAIVRQVIGFRPDVEDLSQDTLLRVMEKVRNGDIRDPERLSGFIASVARNTAIAHLRKGRRNEAGIDVDPLDPGQDPHGMVVREEHANVVRQVLSSLGQPRDREVLYQFYVAEEGKESICRRLGLSSLHFNRVLYRARDRFREIYENRIAGRDRSATDRT